MALGVTRGFENVDMVVESSLSPVGDIESEKPPGGWIIGDGDFDLVIIPVSFEFDVVSWDGPIWR